MYVCACSRVRIEVEDLECGMDTVCKAVDGIYF